MKNIKKKNVSKCHFRHKKATRMSFVLVIKIEEADRFIAGIVIGE